MYAIVGASGNTGSVVAGNLLAYGEKVRAIGRDAQRLEGLVRKGAEAFEANIDDGAALTKAFSGATAVYLMIPPNPSHPHVLEHSEEMGKALADAVKNSGVKHAVVLSSVGADKPEKTGPVVGLHNLEQRLNAVPALNALYLRAGYFMENLLPQAGIIQNFGQLAGPLRSDLKVPMIATQDIGIAAAEALRKLEFTGHQTAELQGQRDLSYHEVALIVGKAIGRPGLGYTQLGAVQLKPALMQTGMSANMADLLLEMAAALDSGYMVALEPRSARNTTPTTIEAFVAEKFLPKFKAMAAKA